MRDLSKNEQVAAETIPGAYAVNGHLMLPACLAPDERECRELIAVGRVAEVAAEVTRREWLRSSDGRAHMESIQVVPMSAEQRAACNVAAESLRASAIARHNRRNAKLRTKYPQHAEHFRDR